MVDLNGWFTPPWQSVEISTSLYDLDFISCDEILNNAKACMF